MNDLAVRPSQPTAAVSLATKISWGIGSLGTISYINTVTALVLVYLTTVVKLEPLLAGALVTGARIFDAVTDPVMGWISDRTRSRWGRRRPYLLLGALICGLALPLLYNIPLEESESMRVAWVLAALLFYSIGFTVFNVPYLTMPLEMTADNQERLSIMSSRVAFMTLGTFVGSSLAPLVLQWFGRDARAFSLMGMVFGAFVFAVMATAFVGTARARTRAAEVQHRPFREQWRSAIENRPFLILMGVKVLQFIGIAAHSSTLAYFVTTVMKRDFKFMAVYGVIVGTSTIVSLLLWRPLARRISKRSGFMIGVVGYVFITLSWLLSGAGESMVVFLLRPILMGIFVSAVLLFGQVVWIDAVDYDYRRTGLRREGMFTSVYVFVERLGYSIAPLLLGALLQWMGFNKNLPLESQSSSAQTAVIISLVAIPVVTFTLSLALLTRYDLSDEKLAATRQFNNPTGELREAQ